MEIFKSGTSFLKRGESMLGVCVHAFACVLMDLMCQTWGWWWGLRCCYLMPLKRGTDPLLTARKNNEKIPYYFLCQQQNICILNCTDISLQFLFCAAWCAACTGSWNGSLPHPWAPLSAPAWALAVPRGFSAVPVCSSYFFLHLYKIYIFPC